MTEKPTKAPRVQGGITSTDLVLSSWMADNADVFPKILELHVPDGAKIADVTWGKGAFWRKVDHSRYELCSCF